MSVKAAAAIQSLVERAAKEGGFPVRLIVMDSTRSLYVAEFQDGSGADPIISLAIPEDPAYIAMPPYEIVTQDGQGTVRAVTLERIDDADAPPSEEVS